VNPSPFSGLHLVATAHLVLTVVSALLSPYIPGDRTLSMAVWGIGGLAVFAFVAWRSARACYPVGPIGRLASMCPALAVSAASLLISFVVLVDLWEWQGYGH
jgi:hypothetical protein